jgi:HSP20 family molecular chaperone IbpA
MSRSFYIGESLTEEDVKAKFEDGVLTLDFPKEKAIKLPERKTIQIEG